MALLRCRKGKLVLRAAARVANAIIASWGRGFAGDAPSVEAIRASIRNVRLTACRSEVDRISRKATRPKPRPRHSQTKAEGEDVCVIKYCVPRISPEFHHQLPRTTPLD